ncbi:MAG: InlB B-repeat-containing protein [Lachnospiraceae bacterium]|nr:InlB B-repeat-containing protein [Lachnospiraceae bacterium]
MVLSTLVGGLPYATLDVEAAGTEKKVTGLGVKAIANPQVAESTQSPWSGSYVYYGKFDGTNPTKYRVLDKASSDFGVNGKSLLLDCDSVLYNSRFDSDGVPNEGASRPNQWQYSDIYHSLNGDGFLTRSGNLTDAERKAIAGSTKANAATGDGDLMLFYQYAPLTGEKIFLLDDREATRQSYGYWGQGEDPEYTFAANRKKRGTNSSWWTRSSEIFTDDSTNYANYVQNLGLIHYTNARNSRGVSPAFNVRQDKIMFSSLVSGESGQPGAEYKLTLVDDSISMSPMRTSGIERTGNTIKVDYSVYGSYNQLSVVMTDGYWGNGIDENSGWNDGATLKYYHKLDYGYGEGTFELPADYSSDWRVYLIAEKVNGGNATDYASEPVLVPIPELPATSIRMVGSNLMKGDSEWSVEETVLKLDNGDYKLDTDIDTSNVISVTGNVTIDLNGHGIRHNSTTPGNVIRINPEATLTIIDSTGNSVNHYYYIDDSNHIGKICNESDTAYQSASKRGSFEGGYITGGYSSGISGSGSGIDVENGGTLIMNAGTIIGNNGSSSEHKGGGVLNNGEFILNNGRIIGNYSNGDGAGVYCGSTGSKFTMNGGNIQYNYAKDEGCGVYVVEEATFVMNDEDDGINCSIVNNESKESMGCVYCENNATFTMTGGLIQNNASKAGTKKGVGVYIHNGATFNLSGESEINGNTDADNNKSNVYLDESNITITGELGNVTPISVSKGSTGVFTNTANDKLAYNDESKFIAEGVFYVDKDPSSNQLRLTQGFMLKYNANGGTGSTPDSQIQATTGDVTVAYKPSSLAKMSNYFNGWNTNRAGSGDNYQGGSTYNLQSSTVLYANWEPLTDNQKPKAKEGLVYNGSSQELITAPTGALPTGYTIQYSIDGGQNYSTDIPKGSSVGLYTVKVKYKGDNTHDDFEGEDIEVGIVPDKSNEDIVNVMVEVKPKDMEYTGSPMELVNVPTTELPAGYTILYAVTKDDVQPDESAFSTDVPTATNIGDYYIWYKVKNGNDDVTLVGVVVSSIKEKSEPTPDSTPSSNEDSNADNNGSSTTTSYTTSEVVMSNGNTKLSKAPKTADKLWFFQWIFD